LEGSARLAGFLIWAALHVVNVLFATDEDSMACFQVALVSVEQAEILLGNFFVNFWAVNDLIKHLKEFETSEEGGVVFETLGYH